MLAHTELSGTLPPQLAALGNVEAITLHDNSLSGTLPASWGSSPLARSLQGLALGANRLSGTLPPQFGDLSLAYLMAGGNRLSGSIPVSWGGMRALKEIDLSVNKVRMGVASPRGTARVCVRVHRARGGGTRARVSVFFDAPLRASAALWDGAVCGASAAIPGEVPRGLQQGVPPLSGPATWLLTRTLSMRSARDACSSLPTLFAPADSLCTCQLSRHGSARIGATPAARHRVLAG